MNQIERAAHAKELLESPIFKAVHAEIRAEIITQLETVGIDDPKQHELVLLLQIHNRHKKKLERWVDDGKVEEKKFRVRDLMDGLKESWKG